MRLFSVSLAGLMGLAAIATIAGCTPATPPASAPVAQGCAPGAPWQPAGYDNGKWVPGHCQGQAAR